MNIELAQKLAVDALEDVKAKDIVVLNTKPLTSMFDCMIVTTRDDHAIKHSGQGCGGENHSVSGC